MKKIAVLLSIIIIFNISNIVYSANNELNYSQPLELCGESAILIDRDTGQILYEKNSHTKLYPASTTKIMTGILAIENGNLNDIVTINEDVVNETDGTHIALEPGEQLTLEDLLYALLIESANDAAVAIAIHISGSVDKFANLMNEKAKELGALDTHFVNPNGLPNKNHVTSAYDLALIARYAMKNDIFKNIVKNYNYIIPKTNKKNEERYLKSSNRLLYSTQKIDVDGQTIPIKYDGIDGVKSGYTIEAQQCLVSSASRNNQRLIAVVLKSDGKKIYSDSHKLLNYGFDNFEKVNLSFKNEFIDNIPIAKGTTPFVAGIIKDNLIVTIPKGKIDSIEKKVTISKSNTAPITKGDTLGKVEYFLAGEKLGQVDIVSTLTINKTPIKSIVLKVIAKFGIFILLIFFIIWKINTSSQKKKKRKKYTYVKM